MNTDIPNILRDTFAHFASMAPEAAALSRTRLRDELHAMMADITAGQSPRTLYTDEARDAELYRRLNSLFAATGGQSLFHILRLVDDACWLSKYHSEQTLADAIYAHLHDYIAPDSPISRLLDLWEAAINPERDKSMPAASK